VIFEERDRGRRTGRRDITSWQKKCRPPHFEEAQRAAVPPRTSEVILHLSISATDKMQKISMQFFPVSGLYEIEADGRGFFGAFSRFDNG
jgi:hypothetical protein